MDLKDLGVSDNEGSITASDNTDEGGGTGGGGATASMLGTVDDEAFETLAAEIREVLAELAQDKSMDAFRGEYEKLFNALEKSHKNEKRLNTKCQELGSEIASKQARVDAAMDKTGEDQDTITSLRKEIEKAWKMVDMTQEREERARETIEALNTEIQSLTKIIEEKTLGAEDTNLNELRKLRDELTNQRDNLKAEVSALTAEQEVSAKQITELKDEKVGLESKITGLQQEVQSKTNEMNREIRRKERAEREVKTLRHDIESKNKEINQLKVDNTRVQDQVATLETSLSEQKHLTEGFEKRLEMINASSVELQAQLDTQASAMQVLETENAQKSSDIAVKEEEITKAKLDVTRTNRELEDSKKKIMAVEKTREDLQQDKTRYKQEVAELKKTINEFKHTTLVDKKNLDSRDQDIVALEHTIKRNSALSQKQQKEIQTVLDESLALRNQIKTLKTSVEKQRKSISQIEEERDHYFNEATDQARKVETLLEEVRNEEAINFSFRKEMTDIESQLKQQQNLYQAVRNDKSVLQRSLREANDAISDLKGKLRVLNHQFDQLKEEIDAKESALIKVNQEQAKIIKEKEDLQAQVEYSKKDVKDTNESLGSAEKSYKLIQDKLRQTVKEMNETKDKLDKAIKERIFLDKKLGAINEKMVSLEKKVAVQERANARGESLYKEREEDIRVLKLEVKRLRHEEEVLSKNTKSMLEMKKEILMLQRDLLQERTKVKALTTELENPLNVHRWRKLTGKDPPALEMVQKIQALQKRLIARKEEIVDRELNIQEKDRVIDELKGALLRQQPESELVEEVKTLRSDLKKKTSQVHGLMAEKNMNNSDLTSMKAVQEKLEDELHAAKRKSLDLSKKYAKLKEQNATMLKSLSDLGVQVVNGTPGHRINGLDDSLDGMFTTGGPEVSVAAAPTTNLPQTRAKFVGGGFNLSQPAT